ncbi:WcaF family extracellular polysaccharide biosynthesis acetyltransferase [Pontibacter sp. CAU 1760]
MLAEERKQVNLAAYDNSWFNTGAGGIKRTLWFFVNVVFFVNPLNPVSAIKVLLLKLFGARVGAGVVIKPGVNIKYPWLLSIGNHVWVGENVWIDNLTAITIADNVVLSQGAMLLTGSHNFKRVTFDLQVSEIILEEGVWIGAKATVCPGVICGSHSVLAVGSVATKNMDPYTIYQGSPAIPKRPREIS